MPDLDPEPILQCGLFDVRIALIVFYLALHMLNTYHWQSGLDTRHNWLQVTTQNSGISYIPRPVGWPSSQLAINTADHQDTTLQCLSLMHGWLTRFIITVTVLKLRHGRFIRVVQTWDAYGLLSGTPSQEPRLGTSHVTVQLAGVSTKQATGNLIYVDPIQRRSLQVLQQKNTPQGAERSLTAVWLCKILPVVAKPDDSSLT
jgi:hypothetical protein